MSVVQTALIFLGIPVVGILAIAALVYARAADRTPRYRPGGPWQFEPVWYLPHPEHSGPVSSMHSTQPSHAGARAAITGRVAEPATASGGASGEW
ncbi:MAG TPA: hypothetical protein VGB75_19980 [Jatrophihabitans sp.]|jgi:hypothetical protein|uniref:aa3-type cytochrome oxidase subunit CtaJ n=1 Tax=Jatrophihabitans sp. TaxID=1932789 RepID=UPI002F11B77C